MTDKNTVSAVETVRSSESDLDSRYGEIGISALAAALQFRCEVKNPAYAPVAPRRDDHLADRLADVAA